MILRKDDRLDELCWQGRLPNGLELRVIPKKDFARKFAILATNFGSIDTKFQWNGQWMTVPDGIAHYLEHKMFDLPEGNAMERFSALGAYPNASTGYAMTSYHFECTDHFAESLELLLRMVFTPYFTEESVNKERGIIEQEILMYEDSAQTKASEGLLSALYAHHPIRVPIAGTVQSIQSITAPMLYDCHRAFYDPSNMILCVAGDVDARQVEEIAARCTPKSLGFVSQRDFGPEETLEREPVYATHRMDISRPVFEAGFRARSLAVGEDAIRREFVGDLAAELLIGGSSRLFRQLYEENVISQDFYAGYESVRGLGMLIVGGDCSEPGRVVEALVARARQMASQGVEPEDFERLRRAAIGRRIRELDNLEGFCYRICADHMDGADSYDFLEIYQQVTPQEVLAFIQDVVRPERMAVSAVCPQEGE